MLKYFGALLAISFSSGTALACDIPEGWTKMNAEQSSGAIVAAKLPAQPVPVSTQFDMELLVCGAEPSEVTFDATMPAHKHGMNYVPETEMLEDGKYKGVGMFFHMPGSWEITVDLKGDNTQRFTMDATAQ